MTEMSKEAALGNQSKKKPSVAKQKKPADFFKDFDPLKGKRLQVMDEKGEIVDKANHTTFSEDQIKDVYEWMLRVRTLDLRILSYQRQGRILTYPSNQGQEAAQIGSSMAIDPKRDWVAPAFREMGVWLRQGMTVKQYLQYWNGLEIGFQLEKGVKLLPSAVPISSQNQHAVGLAMAAKYKGEDSIVVAYFGDGGTSEGDFHEACNFASVFDAPVIFFCNNNQYAISVPLKEQTRSRTLAQKAVAYGMPGIKVDGNDFFAVYKATKEAADHARAGKGPVLIEAEMYRMGPHTTSDDPTKYRTKEEEDSWKSKDPFIRMQKYLEKAGIWTKKWEDTFVKSFNKEIEEVFAEVEATSVTPLEDLFNYHFETLPPHLDKELNAYKAYLEKKKGK